MDQVDDFSVSDMYADMPRMISTGAAFAAAAGKEDIRTDGDIILGCGHDSFAAIIIRAAGGGLWHSQPLPELCRNPAQTVASCE